MAPTLQSPDYAFGPEKIPMVSASATRAADGSAVSLSLANTSPGQAVTLTVKLAGLAPKSVTGRVLTAPFDGASLEGGALRVKLPAKSVVVLALR